MKILMVSAEVAPFATVGGLSQVNYYLSKSLLKADHDIRVFTPFHGKMNHRKYKTHTLNIPINVPTETQKKNEAEYLTCTLREYSRIKPVSYFVENREYFTLREHVFGYGDDHQRFYLLSKACLEWLVYQHDHDGWMPDVIHTHDWHTGYFNELARTHKRYKKILSTIPILYTVHNFRYQGNFDFSLLPPQEKDNGKSKLVPFFDSEKLQRQNALQRGIQHADWVNTVSPTHALEVLSQEYAEGLDKVLLKRRGVLSGIINGLDTTVFNPASDPLIAQNFSSLSIEKRSLNKVDLQHEFGLEENPTIPLIAFSGRLDKQKGLHLIAEILPDLFKELQIQFILLGGGDQQLANEFRLLQIKYPTQMSTHLYSNFKLPRKIFAGADMILMPSMFEPGGIVALEAMRYGCIPIVRKTGGLADIIDDFNPTTKKGNGFSFSGRRSLGLLIAITRAVETYKNHTLWNNLIKNVLTEDYSWDASMKEYVKLYKKVLKIRKHQLSDNPNPAFQDNTA